MLLDCFQPYLGNSSSSAPKAGFIGERSNSPSNPGVAFKPNVPGIQTGVDPNTLIPQKVLSGLDPVRMKNAVRYGGDHLVSW